MSELEHEGLTNEEIIARLGEHEDRKVNIFAAVVFYSLVGFVSMTIVPTLAGLAFGFGLGAITGLLLLILMVVDKLFGLELSFIVNNRGGLHNYIDNIYLEVVVYIIIAVIMGLIAYMMVKLLILYFKLIKVNKKFIG